MNMPNRTSAGSSLTASIVGQIRANYLDCVGAPPRFLPSERELAQQFGVARGTVRSALSHLEEEGAVRAERGRGYRTLPRIIGQRPGSRLAILWPYAEPVGGSGTHEGKIQSIQDEALQRNLQVQLLRPRGTTPPEIAAELAEANVWGVVMTQDDETAFHTVQLAGLPTVVIDCPQRAYPLDYVMQDNFAGARNAASYLLSRGHTRIAWFGPVRESDHSLERFAGAESALFRQGRHFSRPDIIDICGPKELEAQALRLLQAPDRPRAILALWQGAALAIGQACRRLHLKVGRDIDLVAWSTDAGYRDVLSRVFAPEPPPTMVWNLGEMAGFTIARLLWHLREPHLDPITISIPTRLVLPEPASRRA
jgi:DNA-binding LacI/PurR family transcriptional regulator